VRVFSLHRRFPIAGIWFLSGNIRDQILKLFEIAPRGNA